MRPPDLDLVRVPRLPSAPRGCSRGAATALLVLLAVPFTVLALLQARADTATWDEGIYLAAGLAALEHREIRVNLEHPPLGKVLAALPALLADPVVPRTQAWRDGRQFTYTGEVVEANREAGRLDAVLLASRAAPIAEALLAGLVLHALGARLASREAGLLAAGLWLTSPFVLGLGHVQTIDLPFALAALLACLALVRCLAVRRPRGRDLALLGLACGAAMLTRHTGLVLLGASGLGLVAGTWRAGAWRALGAGALVAVIAWGTVWAGYRALAPTPAPPPAEAGLELLTAGAPAEPPWSAELLTAVPWPAEHALGIRYLARVSDPPAPAYLLGRAWDGARWWYWPAGAVVKLTVGVLVVAVGGLVALRRAPARRAAVLGVLLPAAALTAFVMAQPRPIGTRYLLPSIALLLAATSFVAGVRRRPWGRAALAVLALTQVAALASAHPHSLAWTAPPFRPGYQATSDANLDWFQDFDRVAAWSRGRDPWIALSAPPGFRVEQIPGARQLIGTPEPSRVRGDIAVFGSILTTYRRDELSWLRAYCPVGTIGGSVLLYRIEGPPDLRPGPVAPASPCAEDEASTRRD